LKYLRGLKLSVSEGLWDKEQWISMMKSDETSNGSGIDRRALVSCLADKGLTQAQAERDAFASVRVLSRPTKEPDSAGEVFFSKRG
jgi:hypothetical protein